MWVQLLSVQNIDVAGKLKTFYPGDWVQVGKQTANLWLSRGQARIPAAQDYGHISVNGAGMYCSDPQAAQGMMQMHGGLMFEQWKPKKMELLFEKTIIWDTSLAIRPEFIPIGLGLLDTWEIAVPLLDYKQLAGSIGTEEDHELTKAVTRDLRIPVYDTRLMFVYRNKNTERLFDTWNKDKGEERRLAFLRALYKTPLLVLALPITWTGGHVA